MSTQAEMSAAVQSEMKERKLQVINLTEENHNYSKGRTEKGQKYLSNKQNSKPVCLNEGFLKLREETSRETFKQFPHLPPLPRTPLCPELAEEFKDPPQNPEAISGLCAKSKGDCTVMDPYRN